MDIDISKSKISGSKLHRLEMAIAQTRQNSQEPQFLASNMPVHRQETKQTFILTIILEYRDY
jgi:hypothetical protein